MTFIVLIVGAIIGSFLSVCIYRIPLGRDDILEELAESGNTQPLPESITSLEKNLSIGFPKRSFCTNCGEQLLWWHNIPVVSWIILRGKCSFCSEKISARYPTVELLSALAALLSYSIYGLTPTGFVIYAFCAALIVLSFIDIDFYILPDVITLSGTAIGLCLALLNQFTGIFHEPMAEGVIDALFGILAGGGFLFLVSEVYFRLRKIEGLGMGDVKLLAMTGAFFGPEAALYTIFVGSLLGTVIGLTIILFSDKDMGHHLPFGPYLAAATALFLFTGMELLIAFSELVQLVVSQFL